MIKGVVSAAMVSVIVLGVLNEPETPGGTDASAAAPGTGTALGGSASSPTSDPPPASASDSPAAASPSSSPKMDTALAAVDTLTVKGRAPRTGYARDQFGSGWVDVDRNGCDTRNDMLKAKLTNKTLSGPCKVLAGTLDDPYTRTSIRFEYGGPSEVDVDHLVALADAWQKGAAKWEFAKRVAFANDPLNLQPTDASANRAKGDGDSASWLPPNKAYRCIYVARQVAMKTKYTVWVTAAEKAAMIRVLSTCPDKKLPAPGPQPTIASNTGGQTPRTSTPKPTKSSELGNQDRPAVPDVR